LILATLIDFPHLSGNPNKEEEEPSVFSYLLNPDDKLQSILEFSEIMVARFPSIDIGIRVFIFLHAFSISSLAIPWQNLRL